MPEQARGQRTIDLLGTRLPEFAAWYGKSPTEFAVISRCDLRAWMDRQGRLFYRDDLDQPLAANAAGAAPSHTVSGALAPRDQTSLLHSRHAF